MKYAVVIPAYNEEESVAQVLGDIPKKFSERIIVVDNNSTDKTSEVAQRAGATVLKESRQGYGSACLRGIRELKESPPEILIFLDADYSDYPEDMNRIVEKLEREDLDMVIGSRMLGEAEKGALFPQARIGNWFATSMLMLRFGVKFTDLGPFRAIRWKALEKIQMEDPDFGWTMEMQIKGARHKLKMGEVSVRYRNRVGVSKITGTVKGTLMASYKILWTLFRYSFH